MDLQRLLSLTRKAMDDYQMIQEGDKIAVGISGGKDSLTLLYAMANLRQFYPKKFSLIAITVDLGYEGFDLTPVKLLCEHLQVEYHIVSTEIAKIIFSDKNEASPCSLCAKLRKGALNQKIKELGCNKVAYAHHMDDMIETMVLSMIFEGRFYSFSPVTFLDRMELTVIRPMMYVSEAEVKGFRNKYNLPVVENPCSCRWSHKTSICKRSGTDRSIWITRVLKSGCLPLFWMEIFQAGQEKQNMKERDINERKGLL